MTLSDALNRATDELYVSMSNKPVVITQDDVAALEERVRVAMVGTGYSDPFEVSITLDDAAEFIDVKITSGTVSEEIGLKFESPQGKIMVFVDTDGDGQ